MPQRTVKKEIQPKRPEQKNKIKRIKFEKESNNIIISYIKKSN